MVPSAITFPPSPEPLIGVLNAGSSSLKFAVYEGERQVLVGQVDGLGVRPAAKATGPDGASIAPPDLGPEPPKTAAEAVPRILPWTQQQLQGRRIAALGHRVVHGGMEYGSPQIVTPAVLQYLETLIPLAPLHQPHNLAPIRTVLTHRPDLTQVACFDTAFHRTIPEVAQAFALPYAYHEAGIRRFGFHGLSYEYIASCLPARAPAVAAGRVVVAHLGNGASLCALHNCKSIAVTLGFTALDGLPMGTRCGELDPGVVLHLIRQDHMMPEEVEDMLYRRSGMLGLSGISSDFRDLLGSTDPRARFAVEVFCYRVARNIGSLAAALGGIDALIFTAGVGEHAVPVREAICRACGWLGLELDDAANRRHGPQISAPGSQVLAYVIPTDENLMIARHTRSLLTQAS